MFQHSTYQKKIHSNINSLTRKQRDGKSHEKTTLSCISIFSGAWGALLKLMNNSFGSSNRNPQ